MHDNPVRESRRDSAFVRISRNCVSTLWPLGRNVYRALERARQRRALAQLSDFMLKDIGLSRADADAESRKNFWRG